MEVNQIKTKHETTQRSEHSFNDVYQAFGLKPNLVHLQKASSPRHSKIVEKHIENLDQRSRSSLAQEIYEFIEFWQL